MGRQRDSTFYDNNTKYLNENIIKRYMPIYIAVADLLPSCSNCGAIIDLGCGVGHFAKLIKNRGYERYIGIDFSEGMVQKSIDQVGQFGKYSFILGDLTNSAVQNIYKKYDLFVAIETLEHITNDIKIVESIPINSRFVFTLPTFDAKSHVRYFKSVEQVHKRYNDLLIFSKNIELPWKNANKILLFDTTRK